MILVPTGVRILLAAQPVDFRRGMDSLAALVQQALQTDPFAGDVFIFRAKRADRVKILVYDGTGRRSARLDCRSSWQAPGLRPREKRPLTLRPRRGSWRPARLTRKPVAEIFTSLRPVLCLSLRWSLVLRVMSQSHLVRPCPSDLRSVSWQCRLVLSDCRPVTPDSLC